MYRLVFTDDARKDLLQLQKKAPIAIKKLNALLEELKEHPTTGTGQVEMLKLLNLYCIMIIISLTWVIQF